VIRPKILMRLIHINWVMMFHGLDEIVLKTHLFRPIRYIAFLSPNYWTSNSREPRGARIRKTLEDLGPIYVKFGQTLSTRKDLLPEDIAEELVKLQDKVPPFSADTARKIIEQQLGQSIEEAFAEFDPQPLASASVAQVHTATLHTGEKVIVKVLRPDIEDKIHSDVGLLYELARLAERFWSDARRLRAMEIVAEFEKNHSRRTGSGAGSLQRQRHPRQFQEFRDALHPGNSLAADPPQSLGNGTHLRHSGRRHRRPAQRQCRFQKAGRARRGNLFHPSLSG